MQTIHQQSTISLDAHYQQQQPEMIIIDDIEEEQQTDNTSMVTDIVVNGNENIDVSRAVKSNGKIEKRKRMLERRRNKIHQIKRKWKEVNNMRACVEEEVEENNATTNNAISKDDLKNVLSSLLEGTVLQAMKTMQEEISSLKEQQETLLSIIAKSETSNNTTSVITTPQSSTSTTPTPPHHFSKQQPSQVLPPSSHLLHQPKHHGSVDKDCWVIWNNAIYDKLHLLRRMKTIKYHEWEDFVARDALIWRRHFELKDQYKTSDKKQHYTQYVDYISPVMHAKEFLGKTLQKIREGSFKNKEVSQDMLNKMLDSVSKEANIGPYQQDMLKKKEITPKSKINSPFWWLNLDIYRQLSILVEMKIVSKVDWNNYMKKVMQLSDSILVETDRAQKIITFGEDLMKSIKEKTSTDKWFQFLQKKRLEE